MVQKLHRKLGWKQPWISPIVDPSRLEVPFEVALPTVANQEENLLGATTGGDDDDPLCLQTTLQLQKTFTP